MLSAGLAMLGFASAQQASGHDIITSNYRAQFTVKADGAYTEIVHEVDQLPTQSGVQRGAQMSMGYSGRLQTLGVVSAYTLKKDGTKVPVPKGSIYVQSPPETQQAPTFSDNKVVKVVFSQVAVGDSVSITWKLTQLKPFFPGQFYTTDLEPISRMVKRATVAVTYPSSMDLRWAERGDYSVSESVKGGMKQLTATFAQLEPTYPEPGMVSMAQVSPAFVVTSFPSWSAIGAAYWRRAQDKAVVTPAVQKLADQVAGSTGGLAAARKLYDWEAQNIRYVALELGVGGYVPQSAAQVLSQSYGDCKGYVTLLEALFKAKGIDSVPVLIRAGDDYTLLPAPTPGQFNHAILYLPKYALFLDPTSQYAPFGVLPLADLSKPVVLGGAVSGLANTPSGNLKTDIYTQTSSLTLDAAGKISGRTTIHSGGYVGFTWRRILSRISQAEYPRLVQALLSHYGEGGAGSISTGRLGDLETPLTIKASWTSPAVTQPGNTMSLSHMPTGFTLLPLAQLKTYASPVSRKYPVSVGAFAAHYVTTLTLPEGYSVALNLRNDNFKNAAGSYRASYQLSGRILTADISFVVNDDVYSPKQYAGLKALIEDAVGNVQQPLVLEKKP